MEDQNIDAFNRFLNGKMSESEKRDFEQQLQENEQLQNEFGAYIMANDVIEQEVRNDLKSKMENWGTPKRIFGSGMGIISGLLIVLFGIATASVIWICTEEEEEQWGQYAAINIKALQRSTETEDDIRQLNQYYITGNYAKAQQMIDQMTPSMKDEADIQFIQGLLHYQEQEFQTALSLFALLKENDDLHFSITDQAEYYYLLTLIRMDDCSTECKRNLEKIANDPNHLRQNEAKQLINEISF